MTQTQVQVQRPEDRREVTAQVKKLFGRSKPLFPELCGEDESMLTFITKSVQEEASSRQGVSKGAVRRPFNFAGAAKLKQHNEHHSTCIAAKQIATVGLGHEDTSVRDALDPLCRVSWLHTLLQVDEDFENLGNGFLEVVRNEKGDIAGLHYQPTCDVTMYVEDDNYNFHYRVHSAGSSKSIDILFAAFGDLEDFKRRHTNVKQSRVSELIHFAQPSTYSKWWGVPEWLAATASIELTQALKQHQFDFHMNRGVPEFMLFIMGTKVRKTDWTSIEDSLQAQIGMGNSHKSIAINLTDPNIKVQLEKLAMEGSGDGEYFASMMETLSVNIVSAHRTPPALAGILIPGKMGASNEASNAIMSFQALTIGPRQENFATTLGCTLGNTKFNQGLSLARDSFKFKTIVDEMAEAMKKLKPVDTMGRMKEELADAGTEGRDLEDGVKKGMSERIIARMVKQLILLADDPRDV